MNKQYLIDEIDFEDIGAGYAEFCVKDAKEVEVLDKATIDQLENKYFQLSAMLLSDFLAANNLKIIKTVK